MGLITVNDVKKTFVSGKIEVHALRGVSLDIHDGEFLALAGPSGSGKTTLLNMIGCLDKPTSGEIRIGSQSLGELGRTAAARFRLENIGYVFQAYNLIPVLSAYENAEFTLFLRGVDKEERRKRVMPLLETVGLAGTLDRKPHELSGGQQQRVAVVRALAAHPKLVLADEPTANLDTASATALMDLMRKLNREFNVTFLFSSHDAVVIDRVDRVVRLDSGLIVKDERRERSPEGAPVL